MKVTTEHTAEIIVHLPSEVSVHKHGSERRLIIRATSSESAEAAAGRIQQLAHIIVKATEQSAAA